MSFTLYINKEQWLTHLVKMEEAFPDYLPVIKGNGYGFGNTYLAKAAENIGKAEISVGTLEEARQLYANHSFRQIIVLTPALSPIQEADLHHCTFTIGHITHLEHLLSYRANINSIDPIPLRILLKLQSPMRRYGFAEEDIIKALAAVDSAKLIEVAGFSIHFPLQKTNDAEKQGVINSWLQTLNPLGLHPKTFYLSHVSPDLYKKLTRQHTGVSFRVRLGTSLWLKDDCYKARTTVLDIKSISPGKTFGYKQRKALRGGYLVCVSGGSAAGIGLEGPVYAKGIKDRLKLTVFWLMNIFNLHLSPFAYAGKRLFFAEPPHMQTSLLEFPAKSQLPHIGEEISVKNLRMTIANFDRIVEVEAGSTDSAIDAFQERNIRQGITVES